MSIRATRISQPPRYDRRPRGWRADAQSRLQTSSGRPSSNPPQLIAYTEAHPPHQHRPILIIAFAPDAHVAKRTETAQHGPTLPGRKPRIRRIDYADHRFLWNYS